MSDAKLNSSHKVVSKIFLKKRVVLKKAENLKDKSSLLSELRNNVFGRSADIIIFFDQNGIVIDGNEAFEIVTGYDLQKDLIGRSVFEMPYVPVDPSYRSFFTNFILGKEIKPFEVDWTHKNGQNRCVEIKVSRIKTANGECYGQAVMHDITHRKHAEEKYRQLFDNSKDGILIIDDQGFILNANKSLIKGTGYPLSSLIGKNLARLPFIKLKAKHTLLFPKFLKGEEIKDIDLEWTHKNGEARIAKVHISFIKSGSEKHYAQVVCRDITNEKEAKVKLLNSENNYRAIFEHTGNASVIIEQDMKISFVNSEFEKLSGYRKDQIINQEWFNFFDTKDIAKMKRFHFLRRKNAKLAPRNYEATFIDYQGNKKSVFMTVGMIPGTHQSVASILDITQRKKTENELRQSKKLFDDLVESTPTPIFVVNMDHKVIYWNKAMESMTGIKASEMIGTSDHWKAFYKKKTKMITDLIIDNKSAKEILKLERYKPFKSEKGRAKNTIIGSMFFSNFNGQKKWLRFVIKPLFDLNNKVVGAIETLEDITEEKAMRESLQNRVRELETLYKVTDDQRMITPIHQVLKNVVQNLILACDEVKPARARIQLDGKSYTNLKKGESFVAKIESPINIQNQQRGLIELGYIRKIDNLDSLLLEHEKKVMHVLSQSLSKHIQHREILKRYEKLIHKSVVGIFIGQNEIIQYANPKFARLLKLKNKDIIGASYQKLICNCQPLEILNNQKKVNHQSCKVKLIRGDGREIHLEIYSQEIEYNGKKAVLGTIQDISKIEKAQERQKNFNKELRLKIAHKTQDLQKANKRLQSLNTIKDEFIAIASHELRSPLTSAKGYLSFLMEEELFDHMEADSKNYISRAYDSVENLNYLVNNILDVSRIDTKNIKLDKQRTSIKLLIEHVVQNLNFQKEEKKIQIQLINQLPQQDLNINIDCTRIGQVIRNILENAIRHSSVGGTIFINLNITNAKLRLSISDQGMGVKKSDLFIIFNKFKQANDTLLRHHSGSGLGLYIAKEIIKLHEGRIWCESQAKKGANFIVELPIGK